MKRNGDERKERISISTRSHTRLVIPRKQEKVSTGHRAQKLKLFRKENALLHKLKRI